MSGHINKNVHQHIKNNTNNDSSKNNNKEFIKELKPVKLPITAKHYKTLTE
jgi:hypothetical protein